MDTSTSQKISEITKILNKAKRIFVITGAGISAESGLPTYRGISGLYNNKTTENGLSIETVLSGSVFRKRPEITWKYIAQIEEACRNKKPNRGHEVLAEMEKLFENVCILTQNIDGFHFQAGSTNIIDIHGDIHDIKCTVCNHSIKVKDYSQIKIPPACGACGGLMRPDVVLFEEMLPLKKIKRLDEELQAGFDIIFTIGTTSVFPYIAQPVIIANHKNIPSVEINPDRSEVSSIVSYKLEEKSGVVLDRLWKSLTEN